jgi:hypothetical protein
LPWFAKPVGVHDLQCTVSETVVPTRLALPAAGNEDAGSSGSGPRANHIPRARMYGGRVRIYNSACI